MVSCAFLCCAFSGLCDELISHEGGFIRSGLGGNCDELITHEGESYQVWARRELDCCCREKKIKENTVHLCYKDQSRDVGIEVITVQI